MYTCVSMCIHISTGIQMQEKVIGSLGAGVTGGCDQLDLVAGN